MKEILHHTVYEPKPFGHGGERRVAQIAEIYESAGIVVNEYKMRCMGFKFKYLFPFLRQTFSLYGLKMFLRPKTFYKYARYVLTAMPVTVPFFEQSPDVFVWQSTNEYFQNLCYLAKRNGKRVIAVPHNLESLVPNSKSGSLEERAPKPFLREIKILKQCDSVFCISHEETWLLRLFGVNAFYLPYYPAREAEQQMLDIRQRRQSVEQSKSLLLVGSALNSPTRTGMQQIIDWWKDHAPAGWTLRVGGYHSDKKLIVPNCESIVMLGELSQERMDDELLHCAAQLIYQPATTGVLTRIVESQIAGIPVVANSLSCRSHYEASGVYSFDDLSELEGILSRGIEKPKLPVKPDYNQFVNAILHG